MYRVLYTEYLCKICVDGFEDKIISYYKPVDKKCNFYEKMGNIKFKNTEDAINLICEHMNWEFISITEGKLPNGFSGYILFFKEYNKNGL